MDEFAYLREIAVMRKMEAQWLEPMDAPPCCDAGTCDCKYVADEIRADCARENAK